MEKEPLEFVGGRFDGEVRPVAGMYQGEEVSHAEVGVYERCGGKMHWRGIR